MKKVIVLCLIMVLSVGILAGCGNKTVAAGVTLESCHFTNMISGYDHEVGGVVYPQMDGKVYVDLTFAVFKQDGADFGEKNLSGKLTYQEQEYTLAYCSEGTSGGGVGDKDIKAGRFGRVHLFTRLPEEAMQEKLTVTYTVDGKSYTVKVGELQTKQPMDNKVELKVGNKVETEQNVYTLELMEVLETDTLTASGQDALEYFRAGANTCVRLKITNNSVDPIEDIFAYVGENENFTRMGCRVETENNTKLDSFSSANAIATGETGIVLLFIDADKVLDGMVRINLGGTAFYINIS